MATMATAIQSPHFSSNSVRSSSGEVCSSNVLRVKLRGLGFKRFSDEGRCCATAQLRPGHFAEPSVTAKENASYEKRLTEQEAVAEYLESVGVDTSNLGEDLEVPASLEIVRERVEFLQRIGLSVDDINDYPLILGYSVKRNLIPVLSYLESLGVTTKSLPVLVRKYPQVLHSSVVIDLQPHVEYLEGLGIQRADMGSVLTRYPEVLGFKIEGTISTSTAYLVMLGVNPRRMGFVLTELPQILGMRVGNNIKRKVDFLKSFGLPQSAIAKMIETRPQVLGLDLAEQMRPAVDALVELGVPRDAMSRVITQFPEVLSLDVKAKLAERLPWLSADVGVAESDLPAVLTKLPQILVINTVKAASRVEFLRQAGFSDVGAVVASCPQLLAASIERTLKPNLDYLFATMRRPLAEVEEFPAYLLYSLEDIIRPRHEEILSKGVECSLPWMLNCDDDVFQQRLTAEYAEQRGEDAEPDVPYVVTRRVRLVDDDESEPESTPSQNQEPEEDSLDNMSYMVSHRSRLPVNNNNDDDAQSTSFG